MNFGINYSVTLSLILSCYIFINLSLNPYSLIFPKLSYEITGQNSESLFSSLSRNFENTIYSLNNSQISTSSNPTQSEDQQISTSSNPTQSEDQQISTSSNPTQSEDQQISTSSNPTQSEDQQISTSSNPAT